MKLIFYRSINSGKLFKLQRLPENMTENEVENAIHNINNNPTTYTLEMIETDEYHEILLKKAEEKQVYSAECVQEALNALDNAMDCIKCLRMVKE